MTIKEYVKVRKEELKNEIASLKEPLNFVIVQLNDDEASKAYIRGKLKDSEELGIKARLLKLPISTSQEELLKEIDKLNRDKSVDGFIVQMPLPKQIDEETVKLAISPDKDVDGFHPYNLGCLLRGEKPYSTACTPKGIVYLLDYLLVMHLE